MRKTSYRRWVLLISIMAIWFVGAVSQAVAFGPARKDREIKVLLDLDLSGAQKTQITNILEAYHPQLEIMKADMKQTREKT